MITILHAVVMILVAVALAYHGHLDLALAVSAGYVAGYICGEVAVLSLFKLL